MMRSRSGFLVVRDHSYKAPFHEAGHCVVVKSNVVPLVFCAHGWVRKSADDGALLAALGVMVLSDEKDSSAAR